MVKKYRISDQKSQCKNGNPQETVKFQFTNQRYDCYIFSLYQEYTLTIKCHLAQCSVRGRQFEFGKSAKNALRNILKDKYENYENARRILKIEILYERREKLTKIFGKKCHMLEQTKDLFPLNDRTHGMQTRNTEKYKILKANTERLKKSTVPYIQRMLNSIEEKRKQS